jgi:hypothetical protein
MEEYFYEFWKNQLITVEKGQKQMQDMTKLIMQGLSGFDEVPEMFGKFCSMDFLSKETCDYIKAWEITAEDFQKVFKYYLDLMGLVPKNEYLELANKYNDMDDCIADKTKEMAKQVKIIADQEKMITDLKKEIVDQKKRGVELKKEISEQKMLVVDQQKLAADLKKEIAGQIKSIKQLQSRANG